MVINGDALIHRLLAVVPLWLILGAPAVAQLPNEDAPGAAIYREKCADCHGEQGRGSEAYPAPLTGDLPVDALAELIAATMPEGAPEECDGEQAALVAEYINEAMYSPAAYDRLNPVTVQFSRLTVRQIEQSLSDLLGSFDAPPAWGDQRGLQATYFDHRRIGRWSPEKALIERIDPAINFDFGSDRPPGLPQREEIKDGGAKYSPQEYGIRWTGAVIAPDSGDYEFIIETTNGVRFWVNNPESPENTGFNAVPLPLIDGLVRAGDETVYRESIRLVGGRAYPLKLDFIRFAEPQGYVRLKWKRPGHAEAVIAQRYLLPQPWPRQFVMATAFPPDDHSAGYERGTSVSQAWQDAVTSAALETARYTVQHSLQLAGTSPDDSAEQRREKIEAYCERFVQRAFRRPLSDQEREDYLAARFDGVREDAGIRRVVLMALMSPHFLYREYGQEKFDAHAVASWLAFTLWDSLPDEPLLKAAKKNRLRTRKQIGKQVDRMLGDRRALAKLRRFTRQWLQLDQPSSLVKDSERYPEFDAQLSSDLQTSMELMIDEVLQNRQASFRSLMLDQQWYVNQRLADFYGLPAPEGEGFEKVAADAQSSLRAGVVTHPLLLAQLAYSNSSSPIHRGVFIARRLLGRALKPPPDDIEFELPEAEGQLTTRELVARQTSPTACQGCHQMINPLGFSLEHFDAVGRYRQQEHSRAIDASGTYLDRLGNEVRFDDARDLVEYLAASPECHSAFVRQLFQYLVKQPLRALGADQAAELEEHFAQQELNIRALTREIAVSSALAMRRRAAAEQTAGIR